MIEQTTFKIEYLRFIDKDGKVVQPLPAFANDINTLRTLYRFMLLTRSFDAKAIALQRTGQLGTFPSSLGQEAVSVGMAYPMSPTDVLVPYYRDQGALFIRGVKISELLNYWGGDERGSNYQIPREDFPIAVPVASQYLHACGVGYAIKYRQQERAVLTSVGDGGTSKGDFYEAINLAGAWQLPVVFVINNNEWAISVPRSAQTHATTLAQKAIAAGIPGLQVDGNDVIAVCYAAEKALERARQGGGPTLIEAVTYRLCDHTTADDAKRYVRQQEIEIAREGEPISRLRKYLTDNFGWTDEQDAILQRECTELVDQGVADYLNTPPPSPTDIVDYMYAKLPYAMEEQRQRLAEIKGGKTNA